MDMVYFAELRSAVDKNLERFLKSCIYYFIRNTKGEMTDGSCYSKVDKVCFAYYN